MMERAWMLLNSSLRSLFPGSKHPLNKLRENVQIYGNLAFDRKRIIILVQAQIIQQFYSKLE